MFIKLPTTCNCNTNLYKGLCGSINQTSNSKKVAWSVRFVFLFSYLRNDFES